MPRPVSIIVWRDAEVDPRLFGDAMRLVLVRRRGLPDPFVDVETSMWWARDVARDCGNDVLLWAELPVVSDLTDDDVRNIAVWALDGEALATDGSRGTVDRLCAALGDS